MKFNEIDPLGGGLREQIRELQASPDVIDLFEQPTGESLGRYITELMVVIQSDTPTQSELEPQQN